MRRAVIATALAALAAAAPARAQEFSRFLTCSGTFSAEGGAPRQAHADFALRMNTRTALIEGSNLLPVGETMNFIPTPGRYTMTYLLAPFGTRVVGMPGWFASTILVFYPDLKRLNQIRLSIDRQTGAMEGKLLNERDELLTGFEMTCRAREQSDAPPRM